ncbi:MAG: plasmid stabilization system protein [Candidatus Portnoybacteria bacterium CG06_land_8_20_14_3_00_39_12]|uniref:Plasmid stabilization system protein n=1 Tax=Candidatus Portnoybacteria bacterium CG06_land_8_20_14_3_00_39_12 TaxID=1974809 RepID=A0A2M7AXY0_9BACT|nr:MAG: plasmid stabilization system protein [Candidatus Portnoybacteria bacterium CG06_land_8_20_14_3_00_39_12]
MNWRIDGSKNAEKFLEKNQFAQKEADDLIRKAIHFFEGERINIDIKKLKGKWTGFYRIRKGRIRIIAEFNFDNSVVFIEEIDWRGNIYK